MSRPLNHILECFKAFDLPSIQIIILLTIAIFQFYLPCLKERGISDLMMWVLRFYPLRERRKTHVIHSIGLYDNQPLELVKTIVFFLNNLGVSILVYFLKIRIKSEEENMWLYSQLLAESWHHTQQTLLVCFSKAYKYASQLGSLTSNNFIIRASQPSRVPRQRLVRIGWTSYPRHGSTLVWIFSLYSYPNPCPNTCNV